MKFKDITRVCGYCNKEFTKSTFYSVVSTKWTHDGQNNYTADSLKSLVLCEDCGEMILNKTSITI